MKFTWNIRKAYREGNRGRERRQRRTEREKERERREAASGEHVKIE